ncbi:MAG TPA: peptidoglycan bridge formation glycyltransferase FemA/FemB family protein [Anaerolineales bacterium]|nr:peptidoglycan bridge formation glycyltransferase FemA/FemB family protein [Anaerolineales bacterium]
MTLTPHPVSDRDSWNALVTSFPRPHLLQSWEWGELKAGFGWRAERTAWRDPEGRPRAASQVLYRTQRIPLLGLRLSLAYCPKGPALDWADGAVRRELLAGLVRSARQAGAFLLKIDPEVPVSLGPAEEAADASAAEADGAQESSALGVDGAQAASAEAPESPSDLPGRSLISELQAAGWRHSTDRVQFDNTILLDLTPAEEQILAGMKQKTRYNIRLAQRHGVQVRPGGLEDLDLLMRMYAETSSRDGFVIRDPAYYRRAWEDFMGAGMAQPLIAEVEGEPVSGLIAYRFGATAWYLYGMSRSAHREKMPNHLLQWEAMRWARSGGCAHYDLVGIPGRPDPSDSLWGLYRFKVGFGGELLRTIGAWDFPLRPPLFWLYRQVLPRVLAVMRSRGRRRTQALLE